MRILFVIIIDIKMKYIRYFLFSLCCVLTVNGYAEDIKIQLKGKMIEDYKVSTFDIPKDMELDFTALICQEYNEYDGRPYRFMLRNDGDLEFRINKKFLSSFEFQPTTVQELWDVHTIVDVLPSIISDGYLDELRNEMMEDAQTYLSRVREYDLEFDDPQLLDYIHCLLLKIAPQRYLDGKKPEFNVVIEKSYYPDIKMFANGTLAITTRLLSALHSEDELVALMAHEMAHYVLEHSVLNVKKKILRQDRLVFWSSVMTGLSGIIASRNNNIALGTMLAVPLVAAISSQIIDHLGMKYTQKQEKKANEIALELLKYHHYDTDALATAYSRILRFQKETNNSFCLYNFPTQQQNQKRIDDLGSFKALKDVDFERRVSCVVTKIASMDYWNRHYRLCTALINQNIDNQVATSDDYMLKAACQLALYDTPASNQEALNLITQAKELGISSFINKQRTEIVAHLRLGHKQEVKQLLADYLKHLKEADGSSNFVISEIKWVKTMQMKLQVM